MDELEAAIDDLYAGPLDAFIRDRDALAKARVAEADAEGGALVKALRKPVVSAWALNRLAREDLEAVNDLAALGGRLRSAQRRAISGADVEPLREAIEERRRAVSVLARKASDILEAAGIAAASHSGDLTSTLEAAAVDEEAAALLRSGRVIKPLRPPADFGEQGLRVLQGGRGATAPAERGPADETARQARELERELTAARLRERAAEADVARARRRLEELERKRDDARESLDAAEAEHRGAVIEVRRLASALAKHQPSA